MRKTLLFLLFSALLPLGASAQEAYAVYTDDGTLTFYYDDLKNTRPGTVYELNTMYNYPGWQEEHYCDIHKVVFNPSFADARPTSTIYWFEDNMELTEIEGIQYLNTSEVTYMSMMFYGCDGLVNLDLSGFDTSKVEDFDWMFGDCDNLKTIYCGDGWTTENVIYSDGMFYGCYELVGGKGTVYDEDHTDATYAHTDGGSSNPGYLTYKRNTEENKFAYAVYTDDGTLTFYYDTQRTTRPGTTYDLNTGNNMPDWIEDHMDDIEKAVFKPSFADARPTSTAGWFSCSVNEIEGLSFLNTSEVTDMNYMFANCDGLTSLDLSHFDTRKVTDISHMFVNCHSLTNLDLSGWDTSNVICLHEMFSYCHSLTNLDLSGWDTKNVAYMGGMFLDCFNLTNLDLSGWDTSKVTNMNGMFSYCIGLTSLDLSGWDTSRVTNMGWMFGGCQDLQTIYCGANWTTENVENSEYMFDWCYNLVGGKGTVYDEDNTDAAYAHADGGPSNPGYLTFKGNAYAVYTDDGTLTFYYEDTNVIAPRPGTHYALNTGSNDPGWFTGHRTDIKKVKFTPEFADARPTSTYNWFAVNVNETSQLTQISGLEYLNTSEVKTMGGMFYKCNQLKNLNVSHFDTSKVTDMEWMFSFCCGLTRLDVSCWNTENVTNMWGMFNDCSSLVSLDLCGWDTSNVTFMESMFEDCGTLTSIYCGETWSTENVSLSGSENMFLNCTSLVGGNGTVYDASHTDKTYAHIDGAPDYPGYLKYKDGIAYAVYTDDCTLTFYYDIMKNLREGTVYELNTEDNYPGWQEEHYCDINKVVFDPSFAGARPTSTYSWFEENMEPSAILTEIEGIQYLNTSEVTNMAWMFWGCDGLISTNLDLSGFDTSKVTDMSYMFGNCFINNLNLSGWDMSNIENHEEMFFNCTVENHLDLSGWGTHNMTDMSGLFNGCGSASIDLSGWDTSNVTDMSYMFCGGFINLDLSGFDTSNVTDMSYMFCGDFTNLDLSGFDTSKVKNMRGMFSECNLTSLDLSGFDTSNVTDMSEMFFWSDLTTIYCGDGWTTDNVENSEDMFKYCYELVGGKGTVYDDNRTDATYAHADGGPDNPGYFTYKGNIEEDKFAYAVYTNDGTLTFYYENTDVITPRPGTHYALNTGSNDPGWFTGHRTDIKKVVFTPAFADARPTSTYNWFAVSVNETSQLKQISGLQYLNTSEVKTMKLMFYGCDALTNLIVNGFDTSKVTDMEWMFSDCSGLTRLDVSHWNTKNVTSMWGMFNGCGSLTSLDLSGWNTSNVTLMESMFEDCSSLTTIYCGEAWSTEDVSLSDSENMFLNCTNLMGGNGTVYDALHIDKTYANIDGAPVYPGYLTFKSSAVPTNVNGVQVVENGEDVCYGLDGMRVVGKLRGVNIIRKKDGTTVKVVAR